MAKEYDVYQGYVYMICASDDYGHGRSYFSDHPLDALERWFDLNKQFPTCANIMCRYRSDAIALCETATEKILSSLYQIHSSPYKLDFLIHSAKDQADARCKSFYEGSCGDSIFPFDVG